ncbi:transmembrane protein 116-like [Actinia tenebrosa]|uniref:Transmembrane protein 116-like n=1 Tax=Actinia tenebrosa TaxID=6105 RepID=A0A6P8J2A0_ACTTE|nr:transmembrane protein 116-like [Actinia tenebrosa]
MFERNSSNSTYLTRNEMEALSIIYIVTSSLSFFGSASIVIAAILKKKVTNAEIRPIFHLSLADLIASVGLLIGSILYLKNGHSTMQNKICSYLTALSSSFYMSTFLFTVVYGYEVYLKMYDELISRTMSRYAEEAVKFPRIYYLYSLSWLFPLAVTLCLFAIDSGEQGKGSLNDAICGTCLPVFHYRTSNCSVTDADEPDWNSVFKYMFLAILGLSLLAVVIIYILVRNVFRRVQKSGGMMTNHQYKQETLVRRWACLYQVVFILCWLPSIILGICSMVSDFKMSAFYALYIMQASISPLQGFFNCIIYGWRRRGFKEILQQRNYGSMESSNGSHTRTL